MKNITIRPSEYVDGKHDACFESGQSMSIEILDDAELEVLERAIRDYRRAGPKPIDRSDGRTRNDYQQTESPNILYKITRAQVEESAGRPITNDEAVRLSRAFPYSSIPQAIDEVVFAVVGANDPEDPRRGPLCSCGLYGDHDETHERHAEKDDG